MKNILLIDDDDSVIQQVTSSLDSDEYNLLHATSAARGYELALKNLPDLIICSYDIYDSDFDPVLKNLKDENFISGIPFVFLLGKNLVRKQKQQFTQGFDYYIIKPFSSAELKKIVRIALERFENVAKKSEKQLDELRGSLSFALPHEFFTPLNGILGFSDILINDYNNLSREEVIQMLQFINKDAQRLKRLTENFVIFAQLEMIGKDSEKVNAVRNSYFINPVEIITSISKQISKEYDRENDLVLELDNVSIRMGEGYVKKIVQELVSNGFKFSERGSQVIVSQFANDSSVMLTVADHGVGMTPKQVASIGAYMQFERKKQEQQGSGLGLTIAKKIVELHGGLFKMESTPHEGTKVIMIFEN